MTNLVLLVDDSEDDTLVLQHLLRKCGLTNIIYSVRDGDEAIAYLNGDGVFTDRTTHPFPGILILDLRMPRLDGFEVLLWLENQSCRAHLLIVVLTGISDLKLLARAYGLGAHTFLTKPCRPEDIYNMVRAFPKAWSKVRLTMPSPVAGTNDAAREKRTGVVETAPLAFGGRISFPLRCEASKKTLLCLSAKDFAGAAPPAKGERITLEGESQTAESLQMTPRFLFTSLQRLGPEAGQACS